MLDSNRDDFYKIINFWNNIVQLISSSCYLHCNSCYEACWEKLEGICCCCSHWFEHDYKWCQFGFGIRTNLVEHINDHKRKSSSLLFDHVRKRKTRLEEKRRERIERRKNNNKHNNRSNRSNRSSNNTEDNNKNKNSKNRNSNVDQLKIKKQNSTSQPLKDPNNPTVTPIPTTPGTQSMSFVAGPITPVLAPVTTVTTATTATTEISPSPGDMQAQVSTIDLIANLGTSPLEDESDHGATPAASDVVDIGNSSSILTKVPSYAQALPQSAVSCSPIDEEKDSEVFLAQLAAHPHIPAPAGPGGALRQSSDGGDLINSANSLSDANLDGSNYRHDKNSRNKPPLRAQSPECGGGGGVHDHVPLVNFNSGSMYRNTSQSKSSTATHHIGRLKNSTSVTNVGLRAQRSVTTTEAQSSTMLSEISMPSPTASTSKFETRTTYKMSKPLVVLLGIGKYYTMRDLVGVPTDYKNMIHAFNYQMNYPIMYKTSNSMFAQNTQLQLSTTSSDFDLTSDLNSQDTPTNSKNTSADTANEDSKLDTVEEVPPMESADCNVFFDSKGTKKQFGYKYKIEWTSDEIDNFLKEVSNTINDKKNNFDGLIFIISSHGEDEGVLLDSEGKDYQLMEIFSTFDNSTCTKLAGKPKLFIIDACRGQMTSKVHRVFIGAHSLVGNESGQTQTQTQTPSGQHDENPTGPEKKQTGLRLSSPQHHRVPVPSGSATETKIVEQQVEHKETARTDVDESEPPPSVLPPTRGTESKNNDGSSCDTNRNVNNSFKNSKKAKENDNMERKRNEKENEKKNNDINTKDATDENDINRNENNVVNNEEQKAEAKCEKYFHKEEGFRFIYANPEGYAAYDGYKKGGYLIRATFKTFTKVSHCCSKNKNKKNVKNKHVGGSGSRSKTQKKNHNGNKENNDENDLDCIVSEIRTKVSKLTGKMPQIVEDVNRSSWRILFEKQPCC